MTEDEARLLEDGGALQARDRAERAIEPPAVRHGVEVGAHDDRRQPGDTPLPAADDVPGRVDPDGEARLLHQPHEIAPALDVRAAEGHPADPSAGGLSYRAELLEDCQDAFRLDPDEIVRQLGIGLDPPMKASARTSARNIASSRGRRRELRLRSIRLVNRIQKKSPMSMEEI